MYGTCIQFLEDHKRIGFPARKVSKTFKYQIIVHLFKSVTGVIAQKYAQYFHAMVTASALGTMVCLTHRAAY